MSTSALADLAGPTPSWPPQTEALREEVREFLRAEIKVGSFEPNVDTWLGSWDPAFSQKLGKRGWLGMTWPKEYGGHERHPLERFAVLEELLAAGAPVAAHWIAERQTGPLLLRFGTEMQRRRYLPGIAAGTCYFSLGLSEPDTGSDLASVRTRAVPDGSGRWLISGTKIWTSGAHEAHHIVVLCRTEPITDDPHDGLSQFSVDLDAPGITVRPIPLLTGEHHFNEVLFDETPVEETDVVGQLGRGWHQVMSELAYERGGPERFLSVSALVAAYLAALRQPEEDAIAWVGSLFAQTWTLHHMSARVAAALAANRTPDVAAALVKDVGTRFEIEAIDRMRCTIPDGSDRPDFDRLLERAVLHSPGFTLRGGTNEILRSIVVKGLGL